MAATERVVVLMTAEQKTRAQACAEAAAIGLGEYIRRQTFQEADENEEAVLRMLVDELNASTARASQALDAAIAKLDATHERMAAIEANARTQALTEFADINPAALANLMHEEQTA